MSGYEVRRGAKTWAFEGPRELIKAIQDGRIDGADWVSEGDAEQRLSQHPRFRGELIDDEVMEEGDELVLDVDLTPMIDVTFLLLIFFMATTMIVMIKALSAPGSKDQDKGKTQRSVPTRSEVAEKFLFVTVSEDGSALVSGERAVGQESIQSLLERKMAQEGKRTLVIEANDRVRHGDIVTVLDAANLAQADKVLFAKKVPAKK